MFGAAVSEGLAWLGVLLTLYIDVLYSAKKAVVDE